MSEPLAYPLPNPAVRQATSALRAGSGLSLTLPWRVLAVTGPDAASFLQGQVTTDMREVDASQSRPGCLLNLKGRVLISFRIVAVTDGFLLLLPADQYEPTLTRLGKYALFSKVKLEAGKLQVRGLLGSAPLQALAAAGLAWPGATHAVSQQDDAWLVRLPGHERALHILPEAAASEAVTEAALAAWQCASLEAGDLMLPAAASERYQPQEIDYHQLQGVSYQKGCYLGQEIVARLYFRGQLKTGLRLLQADAGAAGALSMGQRLESGGQSVGEIIAAAWPDADQVMVLALVRLDAGDLTLPRESGSVPLSALPITR